MTDFNRNYLMTIDGELVDSERKFAAYNPATAQEIARVPDASKDQLDRAVAAARRAFLTWSKSTASLRRAALNAIGDALENHAEEFMALLTKEQAKPRAGAQGRFWGRCSGAARSPSNGWLKS